MIETEIRNCRYCNKLLPGKARASGQPRYYCNGSCRVAHFRKLRARPDELQALRKQVVELQASLIAEQQFRAELESKVKALEDQLEASGRKRKQRDPLPEGYVPFHTFTLRHCIYVNQARAAINAGHAHISKGRWDTGKQPIDEALSPDNQHELWVLYHNEHQFVECPECPHGSKNRKDRKG